MYSERGIRVITTYWRSRRSKEVLYILLKNVIAEQLRKSKTCVAKWRTNHKTRIRYLGWSHFCSTCYALRSHLRQTQRRRPARPRSTWSEQPWGRHSLQRSYSYERETAKWQHTHTHKHTNSHTAQIQDKNKEKITELPRTYISTLRRGGAKPELWALLSLLQLKLLSAIFIWPEL